MEMLEPVRNQLIFQFVNDTRNGMFNETTKEGIIIVEGRHKQVDEARWGKIVAIGPDVTDYSVDDIVLIEHLRWTNEFRIDNVGYWLTADDQLLATWDDSSNLPV